MNIEVPTEYPLSQDRIVVFEIGLHSKSPMLYRPALHGNWNALSLTRRTLKDKFPTPTVPLRTVLPNRYVFLPDPVYVHAFFSSVLAVVEAPLHNTGPGFYSFCLHFVTLGSAQTLTEISVPGNFLGGDMRPARKADHSAICAEEWKPNILSSLRVSMICYGKAVLDITVTEMWLICSWRLYYLPWFTYFKLNLFL